jgi:hypothetical protein
MIVNILMQCKNIKMDKSKQVGDPNVPSAVN